MKNKIWIKSLVLVLCLIIPALFLSACGGDNSSTGGNSAGGNSSGGNSYAWGKTFTYQGTTLNDYDSFGGNNGTPRAQLLKEEFDKGNLDFENIDLFGNPPAMPSIYKSMSADEFLDNLTSRMESKLSTICKDVTIVVGTEAEKTITVNNKTYTLVETGVGTNFYKLVDENATDSSVLYQGMMCSILTSDASGQDLKSGLNISVFDEDANAKISIEKVIINIPTLTKIDDETAEMVNNRSVISIGLTPYFNELVG